MVLKVSEVTELCPFCRLHKVSETMKLGKTENKYKNFRYMYQLQNHTNVGYKNLKNLKNYGSLTLRTIEKQWQFHGKTMALTFFVSKKVSKVSRKCLENCEKYLVPR